ncbi:MAG: 6-carboxytetrahydropterin synthase QueD [Armatimonadetes bacterium]|nr:6-carboxytetrahydropterin synthase QueD [Armatimonadota bacterium]
MKISKEFTFDSAHRLKWHKGKCQNFHGHTYKLIVTVEGKLNQDGIVMDFADLKNEVKKKVLNILDHKNLNEIFENPTAENIAIWIWEKLKELNLTEIKLWETPTSYVIYNGK